MRKSWSFVKGNLGGHLNTNNAGLICPTRIPAVRILEGFACFKHLRIPRILAGVLVIQRILKMPFCGAVLWRLVDFVWTDFTKNWVEEVCCVLLQIKESLYWFQNELIHADTNTGCQLRVCLKSKFDAQYKFLLWHFAFSYLNCSNANYQLCFLGLHC